MADSENAPREQLRLAQIISLFLLLAIGLVFAENARRQRSEAEYRAASEWYSSTESMLGRLRALKSLNNAFFQGVAFELVTEGALCNEQTHQCETQHFGGIRNFGILGTDSNGGWSYGDSELGWKFEGEARKAGEQLEQLFKTKTSISRPDIEDILKNTISEQFRKTIEARDLDNLVELKNTGKWPLEIHWIANGRIHVVITSGGTPIGYGSEPAQQGHVRVWHVTQLLMTHPDFESREELLTKEWEAAFQSFTKVGNQPTQLAIFGSEIRLEPLLYVVAITIGITGLSVLFLIQVKLDRAKPDAKVAALYPTFGRFTASEPEDPQLRRICEIVWWSFALAPSLLLTVGILVRYIVVGTEGARFYSTLSRTLFVMTNDAFSLSVDGINLCCLALCVTSIGSLEQLRKRPGLSKSAPALSVIAGGVCFLSFVLAHGFLDPYHLPRSIIYLGLIGIWISAMFYSLKKGLREFWIVSSFVVLSLIIFATF